MNRSKGIFLAMLSSVIFGFAFTLAPMTYGANGSNAVMLTFLRNAICLPVLLAILLFLRIPLRVTRVLLGKFALLGLLGSAASALLLNLSFSYIDVGVATTVTFIYPVFVSVGCAVLFRDRLSTRGLIALCIALSGVVCFFVSASGSASSDGRGTLGMVLSMASAVFYSFYLIYIDKSGVKAEHPLKVTFYVAMFAGLGMLVFGTATSQFAFERLTGEAWVITIIFSMLCSVIGLPLMQLGIKHIGATTTALVTMLEPITSVVLGVLILGEQITALKITGCVFILLGVLLLSLPTRTNAKNNA